MREDKREMRTIVRIKTLQTALATARAGKRVGLVPTMGAFHEGHLALMRRARRECGIVVVSLFVNPTQFGLGEDYDAYPRHLASDRVKAKSAGADFLWTPGVEDLYPEGDRTTVEVGAVGRRWEGEHRPGHFRGVATVVAKLFTTVQPDRAYFGWKDYQQVCVIRQMTRDLLFPVALRILPTVREANGLAMSSRNERLSPEARAAAPSLYRALQSAYAMAQQGERRAKMIVEQVASVLRAFPPLQIDYVALCHPDTLEPIAQITDIAVLLAAIRIGSVRLIDNIVLSGKRLSAPPRRTSVDQRSQNKLETS